MSGFGLRAFKKVEDDKHKEESRLYFDHLVIGDNWEAALKYFKLLRSNPDQTVRLISSSILTKKLVENDFKSRMNTIRDEALAKKIIDYNVKLEILKNESESLFYKDTKFHKFSGRAKPHELKEDEDIFKESLYSYKWESLFHDDDLENFDDKILKYQYNKFIDEIEFVEPTDLVEKTHFKILTAENETFECENLHWCLSPKEFYKLVKNKDMLDDSIHQYCNKLESRTSLTVAFKVAGEFHSDSNTIYLPQSVTHEWGHFICEIEKYDPELNEQKMKALMFVTEEISTEEELAKKIKLMTRVIDRVFPEFAKLQKEEFINYRLHSFIKCQDDSLAHSMKEKHPMLHFYGEGAPLVNGEGTRYLARAILSL